MERGNDTTAQTTNQGKPQTLKLSVHIQDDPTVFPPNPPYKYYLEWKDDKGGTKKGNRLTFNNEENGEPKYNGCDLTFDLVDETGKGFKFMDAKKLPGGDPDPECAPMWVKVVQDFEEPCPKGEFWDQFHTVSVEANNMRLRVRNENDYQATFKFALLFSRTPNHGPHEIMYDPDGTNGNGSKPLM